MILVLSVKVICNKSLRDQFLYQYNGRPYIDYQGNRLFRVVGPQSQYL